MFAPNEIIHVYCYRDIYENSYDINNPEVIPPGDIIFCEACNLREFFEALKKHPERKITLLSCESDYGVVYQQEYHSNQDIFKCFYRTNWQEISQNTDNYLNIVMTGADASRCNINDKFAIKMDGHTACTFNEIPENVIAWYISNMAINEPKCYFLPLGVNSQGDLSLFQEFFVKKQELFLTQKLEQKWYYINFDVNTYDRFELKKYCRHLNKDLIFQKWATFIETPKPIREFYDDIIHHCFNCCPPGNGFDSYRTYESLYLGNWPICPINRFSANMINIGFPIILVENMYGITKNVLQDMLKAQYKRLSEINFDILKKSYWFSKIWGNS